MKECPICKSAVRWIRMPPCETETTGRICLWECIRCSFYEEKIDKRRIKAKPCYDGSFSPPDKITKQDLLDKVDEWEEIDKKAVEEIVARKKKEREDVEDVNRGVEAFEHKYKPW